METVKVIISNEEKRAEIMLKFNEDETMDVDVEFIPEIKSDNKEHYL